MNRTDYLFVEGSSENWSLWKGIREERKAQKVHDGPVDEVMDPHSHLSPPIM